MLAEKARQLATETRQDRQDGQYDLVIYAIEERAKDGQFEYQYPAILNERTMEKLKFLGYIVSGKDMPIFW